MKLLFMCVWFVSASATSLETIMMNFTHKGHCDGLICDVFVCIPQIAICDNQQNCNDGTDEQFCPCPDNKFRCRDGNQCIPVSLICDGSEDCDDSSDEDSEICTESEEGSATSALCSENMIYCDDRSCISISKVCDGYQDCDDRSDEFYCGSYGEEEHIETDYTFVADKSPELFSNYIIVVTTVVAYFCYTM